MPTEREEIIEIFEPQKIDATSPEARTVIDGDHNKNGPTAADRPEPDCRPLIRLRAGLHTAVAERSEQAILEAGLPVYVGAAGLVYPAAKEVETVEGVCTTITQLVGISTPMMMQFMDQAARYERFDARRYAWVPAKPPKDI